MRLSHTLVRAWLVACLILHCLWQLSGCGGSVVAGGVGSGGSGVAEGVVTGFGSVLVDGVAYSDAEAAVQRWGEDGVGEVKLGQRVRVVHNGQGQAQRIVVLPQLIGPASQAPNGQGDFILMGQRVRIVPSSDTDYPATVFDGLTQVAAGDALEVHGSWSRDGDGRMLLIAHRIEKLPALPDTVLLTAPVYARQGSQLTLDDAARTPVTANDLPEGVQAGTLASLWLSAATVQTTSSASQPWVAVRIDLASISSEGSTTVDLQAVVTDRDSQQGRIQVQGLWVKLPADWRDAPPANGTPLQLRLERNGNDWQASSLDTQRTSAVPAVEIKGSLRWRSGASSLQLRGTTVALPSDVLSASCSSLQDGQEVFVRLKAERRSPGLPPQASAIECSSQVPDSSVQEAQGTLLSVNADQGTLDVRVGDATLTLSWARGQTLMPPASRLRSGMAIEIEYLRGSTGLMLRKLKTQ